MRALIEDYAKRRDPLDLGYSLCKQLDDVTELKELAGNPFYLDMLCAAGFKTSPNSRPSRTPLFRSLVNTIADCCHYNHAATGYAFTPATRVLSEDVAYRLLCRDSDFPYHFDDKAISTFAQDQGQLASTWRQAKLTRLVNECNGLYAFMHPSLHDYLAAQAMTRHFRDGTLSIDGIGLNPKWFSSLRFVFGNLHVSDVPTSLRDWIANLSSVPDRFAVVCAKTAYFLAEIHGYTPHLHEIGIDIRPTLWQGFLSSPHPIPYAQALSILDPTYAIAQACSLNAGPEDIILRLRVLERTIPSGHPQQMEFQEFLIDKEIRAGFRLPTRQVAESLHDSGFLPSGILEWSTPLSLVNGRHGISEIIESILAESNPNGRISLYSELAKWKTEKAQTFLIDAFNSEPDEQVLLLLGLLRSFGTQAAYDAIDNALSRLAQNEEWLTRGLDVLADTPLYRTTTTIHEYLAPRWSQRIRVNAVHAFAACKQCYPFNDLAKLAHTSEGDIEVRKAVFRALGRACCPDFCRQLHEDECTQRPDPDEQSAMWDYLTSISTAIDNDPQLADCLEVIESMFAYHAESGVAMPRPMILAARCFRRSERIQKILENLAWNSEEPTETRAAAIAAVSVKGDKSVLEKIKGVLIESLTQESLASVARECAGRLAGSSPDLLLDLNHPIVETELWKMSLRTGMLVFGDYIKDPAHGTASGGSERLDRLPAQDDAPAIGARKLSKVGEAGRVKRPSTAKQLPRREGQEYMTVEIAKLMQWFRDSYGELDGPRIPLDEKRLIETWKESTRCSRSEARAYRIAAVFCQLAGMAFPIEKADWDLSSLDVIFDAGLKLVRQWKPLIRVLRLDDLPATASVQPPIAGPRRELVAHLLNVVPSPRGKLVSKVGRPTKTERNAT